MPITTINKKKHPITKYLIAKYLFELPMFKHILLYKKLYLKCVCVRRRGASDSRMRVAGSTACVPAQARELRTKPANVCKSACEQCHVHARLAGIESGGGARVSAIIQAAACM